MHDNDTVPAAVAFLIFALLGVLIITSFVFVGIGAVRLRQTNSNAVLALGKNYVPVEASPDENEAVEEEPVSPIVILVHGKPVEFDEGSPVTIDFRVFVPIRGVLEALNYAVSWDERAGVAMFSRGTNTVIVTMDEETFSMNGEARHLDIPAQIIDGVPMFPVGPILRSVGFSVSHDQESNVVSIINRPTPPPTPAPEASPTPTPTPRPRATPRPAPVLVTCNNCSGSGTVMCVSCNGIGGGRGTPLTSIPHQVAAASDVWWCTVCEGRATVTCSPCRGSGTVNAN